MHYLQTYDVPMTRQRQLLLVLVGVIAIVITGLCSMSASFDKFIPEPNPQDSKEYYQRKQAILKQQNGLKVRNVTNSLPHKSVIPANTVEDIFIKEAKTKSVVYRIGP